jgi:hypothetical protein
VSEEVTVCRSMFSVGVVQDLGLAEMEHIEVGLAASGAGPAERGTHFVVVVPLLFEGLATSRVLSSVAPWPNIDGPVVGRPRLGRV